MRSILCGLDRDRGGQQVCPQDMGVPMEELTPRQLLQALVGFPTVSTGSNLDLVDWLDGYLAGHGIAAHRHWNEDRSKAALFAHVGPKVAGGVGCGGGGGGVGGGGGGGRAGAVGPGGTAPGVWAGVPLKKGGVFPLWRS